MGIINDQEPNLARFKILCINRDLLVNLLSLSGDRLIRIDGMPFDASIVGVSDQLFFDTDNIAMKITSCTFPVVQPGQPAELLELSCKSLRPDCTMGLSDLREFAREPEYRTMFVPENTVLPNIGADYRKSHASCPQCGSIQVSVSISEPLGDTDSNKAKCRECPWTGIVHDMQPSGITVAKTS